MRTIHRLAFLASIKLNKLTAVIAATCGEVSSGKRVHGLRVFRQLFELRLRGPVRLSLGHGYEDDEIQDRDG
jgi:hypothetical protein